ncbi:MAG: phenylalanine--tRNA ligase subunit alpha [Burkholderiales bacterium]|nr:phenylalanine--tRNA ligase subunit alpha [Burkholderiales bacterium]
MLDLDGIVSRALAAFSAASDAASLENAKARFLGKSGELTALQAGLKSLSPEERKSFGAKFNAAKQSIEAALEARRAELADAKLTARLSEEALDVTLAGRGRGRGGVHPVIRTWQRIEAIWHSLGFEIADGPEIETDWYNFTALNNPENHPARSMQDTFYVDLKDKDGLPLLLRYRVDSDATHSPMFHQVEGLWIDEHISFADLKGVYTDFLRRFFENDELEVRFRPSFFPFTEPSAEIDMRFRQGGWLEISGSGQVHPSVVRNFGLDPERYIGFAFGSGLERLTMLRYSIDDLRLFFDGDLRFLEQFE